MELIRGAVNRWTRPLLWSRAMLSERSKSLWLRLTGVLSVAAHLIRLLMRANRGDAATINSSSAVSIQGNRSLRSQARFSGRPSRSLRDW
jgi:hypothetical protein